jgi:DNA-binding NtrC family response regulator
MSESADSVLVVDDDEAVGAVLAAQIVQSGSKAVRVESGPAALAALQAHHFDAVVTDLRMPGMDGMALLAKIVAGWPGLPVIVLTAHGTVPLAVEAMRAGAADFLLKPFDREQVVYVIHKAMLAGRHAEARVEDPTQRPVSLSTASAAMREVVDLLTRAAQGTATILLRGESGTGKELAARAVHLMSPRKAGPFVALHCAALPEALLESELFGYEKGAFTGAACRKPGRIEMAEGGTLFLDEIGDVQLQTQVKLLRVLQERSFERLGGTQPVRVDVRVIAATHQDLEALIRAKTFREDLFYRLNVVPIMMPPLRARREDIESLARGFATTLGPANGKPGAVLEPAALERLARESWPGNVRQLQNFVERLIVLGDGDIVRVADVERELTRATPRAADEPDKGATLDDQRRGMEKDALRQALDRAAGNRALAARLLGISRRSLYYKLAEHGLGATD